MESRFETKRANLFFLVIIILQTVFSLAYSFFYRYLAAPEYLASFVLEVSVLFIPSILYIIFTKRSLKETLRLNLINLKSIGLIIVISFLSQPLMMLLGAIAQVFFKNYVSDVIFSMRNLPFTVLLGFIALTPAICEETVLRGVVLSGYKQIDIKKAALMNGLLFGLFHLNPQQFLYAFAMGFIFSYLVYITNSILSSILCHFMINGAQLLMSYIEIKSKLVTSDTLKKSASISLSDKLYSILFLTMFATIFTWFLFLAIKRLRDINSDGIKSREMNIEKSYEKVFNWPIGVIIVIYILYTGASIILGRH